MIDSLTNSMTGHRVQLTVPDALEAARWVNSLVRQESELYSDTSLVNVDGQVSVEFMDAADSDSLTQPPRIVDLGANHLCFRVGDIERAVSYLESRTDVIVLGNIISIPEGPISGNRWIYFKSPWGTLFELQEWPKTPAYFSSTSERLFHEHKELRGANIPTVMGIDHSGYSVADLERTIEFLQQNLDARTVLRTEIKADAKFMNEQLGVNVSGHSEMAMLNVDGLNIELFEHHVGSQERPRLISQYGGNLLYLHGSNKPCDFPVELGVTSEPESMIE